MQPLRQLAHFLAHLGRYMGEALVALDEPANTVTHQVYVNALHGTVELTGDRISLVHYVDQFEREALRAHGK